MPIYTNPFSTTQKSAVEITKTKALLSSSHVKIIATSLFLFVLWRWLGGDTFFSVYVKTIVNSTFLIALVGAILSFAKLLFVIPIGEFDDHTDIKSVVFLSKRIYAIMALFYFLAGIFTSLPLLLIALLLNGLATATLFTTYQTYVRKHTRKEKRGRAFWLFFASMNLAYIIWAVIAATFIPYVPIAYVRLFIIVFAFVSLLIDKRIPEISKKKRKEYFGKHSFLWMYIHEVFNFKPIKRTINLLKWYDGRMYGALSFEALFAVLSYIWFIFVPIVALENNLTLSQIALVFAVMRVPYLLWVFNGALADKVNKKILISVVLVFLSFLYILLGFNESYINIMIITFTISFALSMIRPAVSALVSDYIHKKDEGKITGVQEFVGKVGEIWWSLLFGLLWFFLWGVQGAFIAIGIALLIIVSIVMSKIVLGDVKKIK